MATLLIQKFNPAARIGFEYTVEAVAKTDGESEQFVKELQSKGWSGRVVDKRSKKVVRVFVGA